MQPGTPSAVMAIPPARPDQAVAHFGALLGFETDCWDVHDALSHSRGTADFVLLDVRSVQAYAAGHIEGAVNLPHGRLAAPTLAPFPDGTTFVVYCNGPHCNGADRAAFRLANLGRPVKKMIGGVAGWLDEGFSLTTESLTSPSLTLDPPTVPTTLEQAS